MSTSPRALPHLLELFSDFFKLTRGCESLQQSYVVGLRVKVQMRVADYQMLLAAFVLEDHELQIEQGNRT